MMAANKGKPQRREKGGCNLRRAGWKLRTVAHKEVRTERKQEADNEKKAAIARGVASVMAVTMFTSVSASVLMFDNAGVINQALNLSTSKIVELGDGEATNTVYYDNPYGTDTSDRQATMNMELAVAAENISQAEEGAVLLKNENAALPITTGQRITILATALTTRWTLRATPSTAPRLTPFPPWVWWTRCRPHWAQTT